MNKYINEILCINESIDKFNEYINSNFAIANINKSQFYRIAGTPWDQFELIPWLPYAGVYFIFGYSQEDKSIGVYIGKASLSRKMGHRIYHHLHQFTDSNDYIKSDKNGKKYILEYIGGVDLESNGTIFLVPAFEEYLISCLKDKMKLLNSNGN